MKTKLTILVLCFSSAFAELAPASAQYAVEGERQVTAKMEASLPRPVVNQTWPELRLLDDRVFTQARITAEDPRYVTIRHRQGMAKVDKRLLPAEVASLHSFDEAAAVNQDQKHELELAATARLRAEVAAKKEAETLALLERQRAVATNQPSRQVGGSAPHTFAAQPSADSRPVDGIATGELAEKIAAAVKSRAQIFYESEKRVGSKNTFVYRVRIETEEPTVVPGWRDKWEVEGLAAYQVFDSGRWEDRPGVNRFTASVEAPSGRMVKVVNFRDR